MPMCLRKSLSERHGKKSKPEEKKREITGQAPCCTAEEVEAAVQAAKAAFPGWSGTPAIKRAQIMYKIRELIIRDYEELTYTVAEENGKSWGEADGDVAKAKEGTELATQVPSLMMGESMMDASRGYAFDVLEEIQNKTDVPLVLHGGSGITDEDFRRAISLGIVKVNIATARFHHLTKRAEEYLQAEGKHDYFKLNEAMVQGTYENVKHHDEDVHLPFFVNYRNEKTKGFYLHPVHAANCMRFKFVILYWLILNEE